MVQEKKVSHTKACKLLGTSRNSRYYKKIQPDKDAVVQQAIEAVLPGCRKGRNKVIRLVQKSHNLGAYKIRRVYSKAGLSLYKRPAARRKKVEANPLPICLKANEEWAIDFMSDALTNGRHFRVLNVVDHYSRFCILSHASTSYPARKLVEHLERAIQMYGKPERIRTDNGPEFISKRFQLWLKENGIKWQQIQPGKPQQNAIIERFNKTFREDILDANLFGTIDEANSIIERIKTEYNEVRPHDSHDGLAPKEMIAA